MDRGRKKGMGFWRCSSEDFVCKLGTELGIENRNESAKGNCSGSSEEICSEELVCKLGSERN